MNSETIKKAVKEKYSDVAQYPGDGFCFPVGKNFAIAVGYPAEILEALPESLYESFTGANNPQPFVELAEGETVLDLGCGAGLDLYFYAQAVGENGTVYGLDISDNMVAKADANLRKAGVSNAVLKQGSSDDLPFEDDLFDIVASNGIYNLSPDKDDVMKEVFRVLKPSGRTVFSEIVLTDKPPETALKNMDDWFKCIGGALQEDEFTAKLTDAGFVNIEIISKNRNARTGNKLSICANIRAGKP